MIVRWDGKRLRTYQAFRPSKSDGELTAVTAVTARDIWAVGVDGNVSGVPVAMHWDGKRWARVALPRIAAEARLNDIAAFAADDVWAVGWVGGNKTGPLVMHWNGRDWSVTNLRSLGGASELKALDGASPNDVWAVGTQNLNASSMTGYTELIVHWDGRQWKTVSHGDSFSYRTAIDATSARDIWSIGTIVDQNDFVLHWNGRREQVTYKVGAELGGLSDIAAVSPTNVFAAGDHIVHWDGKQWQLQPTPFLAARHTSIEDIDALSPTELWAVGTHIFAHYSR